MERQEGYYWVKRAGNFKVAEWIGCDWFICGNEETYVDDEFEFINENRIKYPGELPD